MAQLAPPSAPPMQDPQQAGNQAPPPVATLSLTPADIKREVPEPDSSRESLVKEWIAKVKAAKKKQDPVHRRMRDNMRFIHGDQWLSKHESANRYVANITQRLVDQKVAALYAKNPKCVCKRRDTMDFVLWDGTEATLRMAQSALQPKPTGNPMMPFQMPNPMDPQVQQAMALIKDVMQGMQKRTLMSRIAQTMETVMQWYLHNQTPSFKALFKQMIRRTCVCSVGYVKLGYQRFMEMRPEDTQKVTDITQRITEIERIMADLQDDEIDEKNAEVETLRLEIQAIKDNPTLVVEEGLVFDFPRSTSIIFDPACTQLSTFMGCEWVAEEFLLTPDEVKDVYGVDIGKKFIAYTNDGMESVSKSVFNDESDSGLTRTLCFEIYHKKSGLVYHVCDGYPDFLREPAEPRVKLKRFWPWFPLCFNEVEGEENDVFPESDVDLVKPAQREFNRSREGLREHRQANRPKYIAPSGALEEADMEKLSSGDAHVLIQVKSLQLGQSVKDLVQAVEMKGIDPQLYDTTPFSQDFEMVGDSQQANLGAVTDATATQSAIAESSRMTSIQSNGDAVEDLLGELFGESGRILLEEMNYESVVKIAGPGAAWPSLSAQDIANELILDIQGGSAGRPNKAAEIANFDKVAPILLQIPGIPPDFMAKLALQRLDDSLDITDVIQAGLQSIVAQNSAQPPPPPGAPPGMPTGAGVPPGMPPHPPQPPAGAPRIGPQPIHSANPGSMPHMQGGHGLTRQLHPPTPKTPVVGPQSSPNGGIMPHPPGPRPGQVNNVMNGNTPPGYQQPS